MSSLSVHVKRSEEKNSFNKTIYEISEMYEDYAGSWIKDAFQADLDSQKLSKGISGS